MKMMTRPKKVTTMNVIWLIGVAVAGFIMFRASNKQQKEFYSSLVEISYSENLNINVIKAYNEHGTYILNDKYHLKGRTPLLYTTKKFEDGALFSVYESVYIPSVDRIEAPFSLKKKANNDTLYLTQGIDTFMLKLLIDTH